MKCPYCGCTEQKVLDSRAARDEEAIRRRRECEECGRRFTTFEQPEKPHLFVVKRSGLREPFDRNKLFESMSIACRKRPVSHDRLRDAADRLERELYDLCETELPTTEVGERVMAALLDIDEVAYVRFASVYREFDSPSAFREVIDGLKRMRRSARSSQQENKSRLVSTTPN